MRPWERKKLESEADRIAREPRRSEEPPRPARPLAPLRPSPKRSALRRSYGTGEALDAADREEMERRLAVDLGAVRVHRGPAAQAASARLGAQAWALGTDVFLGANAGRASVRHELIHVLQQSTPQVAGLTPAPYEVQRQPAGQQPAAATPGFSVDQAAYLQLIHQALGRMSGGLVESETLATTVVPMLQAMLASPTWRDAQGAEHGGSSVQHAGGGVTLNLRLILDDAAAPPVGGRFIRHGSTDGEMQIMIQANHDAEELAETLYHESMHLASWLINRPTPALGIRPGRRSGPGGAVATLDLSRAAPQIATVRLWLDTLARSVNPRRGAGAQISAADLDRMSRWLVDEVNVRAETEVYRLASVTQEVLTTPGPHVFRGMGANWEINRSMVDHYVFDFSSVFLPADRTGLTAADRQTLAMLLQILEGIFRSRVQRRFSPSPYLVGRGIPRAQVQWTPPPLTPPALRPLPLP
jgi:hypothetical protein